LWRLDWLKKRRKPKVLIRERLRILAVGICLEDRFVLERIGNLLDWELCFSLSPRDAFRLVAQSAFPVILCDRHQPGYPWREVMDRLAACSPRSCILLVSPTNDDYLWWDVLHHRGFDVLIGPLREEMVVRTIGTAARFLSPLPEQSGNYALTHGV
jgi:CheY-like chemotaxis protein